MKNSFRLLMVLGIAVSVATVAGCKKEEPTPSENVETSGTFTDSRDNTTYTWQKIGGQVWMTQNLAYKPSTGNYWAYDNDQSNVATFGYLYDFETAIASVPSGWHIPTEAEWGEIRDFVGKDAAAGKLKSTTYWKAPNTGATNSSKFSAMPGGYYNSVSQTFQKMGEYGIFWNTEPSGSSYSYAMKYDKDYLMRFDIADRKLNGYSIRCVKD